MSKRPWIDAEKRTPPVSTDANRFWLELYIPERVSTDKRQGYALGLHYGQGNFRIQGEKNLTTERIRAWRRLAGEATPVTGRLESYKTSQQVLEEQTPDA